MTDVLQEVLGELDTAPDGLVFIALLQHAPTGEPEATLDRLPPSARERFENWVLSLGPDPKVRDPQRPEATGEIRQAVRTFRAAILRNDEDTPL